MDELFNSISELDKAKILSDLEVQTLFFKKNKIILSNIREENIIGVVIDGYLQIVKNNYNGTKTIIEDLKRNSIFTTKASFISNNEYNVITKEDSKIMLIDFENVLNYVKNTNYFTIFLKNLLKIMSDKNEESNERVQILSNSSIRNKLLSYFKIMSKRNKSKIIYLPFNFTDLADYLAINRSAMTRELKLLREEGFIEINNKKIKLLYDNDGIL
ncbi:MAG: Crp/Fnr family transcriptional regulator [Bacilli bacterium]